MIVSRIEGGLGNQMFQYAYGFYLARQRQCKHWLDVSTYCSGPAHGYLLDQFQIASTPAVESIERKFPLRYRQPDAVQGRVGLSLRLRELLSPGSLKRHKETPFGFHQRHLHVPSQRYLVGYWQSERFFPGMRAELLRHFTLREQLSEASRHVLTRIESTNSLAVHVRRGDYVKSSAAAKIYCHLDQEYYRTAIDDWGRTCAQSSQPSEVFVFSNDIPWCRQQFSLRSPTTFVEHNTPATAHEDLVLMSRAQACIIANSTFSWWGAWLNERPGNVVYAPSKWFQPATLDGANLLPEHWKRI